MPHRRLLIIVNINNREYKPLVRPILSQSQKYIPIYIRCRQILFGSPYTRYLGFPGSSAGKESACNAGDPSSIPGSRRSAGEGIGYPLQCSWAWLSWYKSARNVGDLGSIPGLGRSPGERKGHPLQYSGLENSMDCIVHGVAKSQIQLSDFHFHAQNKSKYHFYY